ncbi:MAG: hypothetical protein ACTHNK_15310 [Thermomicrobiales bacterium]
MRMVDFGNSYMTWIVPHNPADKRVPGHMPWDNSARILLDACCTITNTATGATDDFYLIAPCRTEWMYRDENLFQIPSGEYREIFSATRRLSLGTRQTVEGSLPRSMAALRQEPAPGGPVVTAGLTSLQFTVRTFPEVTILADDAAVVAATQANLPLVAHTEIWDDPRHLRATLEYPIKTMNIQAERQCFQVDTGPLIVPDLAAPEEHWIDLFSLAHIIYNTFDRAEFICRRPTPIMVDGREVASTQHYSAVRVYPARHTLLAAGSPVGRA